MALQGLVVCPNVRAKQMGYYTLPVNGPPVKVRAFRTEFWGLQVIKCARHGRKTGSIAVPLHAGKCKIVQCSLSSFSNGNGSQAENFNENDEDYVYSSVIEAVEVKICAEGFMIKMRDGQQLRCVHNNPQVGYLPDYAPHPAIVLKIEDGSDALLPIIVLEMPCTLLIAAVRNVHIDRPTMYQVVKDMVEKMGFEVKLVRVTKRVHDAYFAKLYLTKAGDETESISFDVRPSDAINIAARCKVPIQVHKDLVYIDGVRVIESVRLATPASDDLLSMKMDRANGEPSFEEKEFDLVRNMTMATDEERYSDAAEWRDKLIRLRAEKNEE